ncbi:MAG: hypothetical protein JWQ02_3680 [Capsulimonas sp.]|nr:hypothetical protein [Capsulimonas sp.]
MVPAPNDDATRAEDGSPPLSGAAPVSSGQTPSPAASRPQDSSEADAPSFSPIEPGAAMSRVAVEQKLTAAGINLRRGRAEEARQGVNEVLTALPRYAPAHEILGDIEAYLGKYTEACSAYRTALKIEPGRPTAELKLGRTALRATEAAGGFQTLQETSSAPLARTGNSIAAFASAVLPGLGQIMQGAYIKGAVLMGVYCLVNLLILMLPDTKNILQDVSSMLAPKHAAGGATPIGGLFWFLAFVSTVDWLFAVIDAGRGND